MQFKIISRAGELLGLGSGVREPRKNNTAKKGVCKRVKVVQPRFLKVTSVVL